MQRKFFRVKVVISKPLKVEGDLLKYHDDSPYLRILKNHVDTEVDEQTMIFMNIQAFLLPKDEVTEEFILFVVSHPYWRKRL